MTLFFASFTFDIRQLVVLGLCCDHVVGHQVAVTTPILSLFTSPVGLQASNLVTECSENTVFIKKGQKRSFGFCLRESLFCHLDHLILPSLFLATGGNGRSQTDCLKH